MIISSPNIPIVPGGQYNIPSPVFPQTGQSWEVELSNFSPENLYVQSCMGSKLINPFTVDTVGDPYGEMPPVPMSFSVADPASGVPATVFPYYVSPRWATWPDRFTQSYPGIIQPPVTVTSPKPATVPPVRKQTTAALSAGTSSTPLAYPLRVTAGSTLVAFVGSNTQNAITLSDNVNGAWTQLIDFPGTGARLLAFIFSNSQGGNISVTATGNPGTSWAIALAEYNNLPSAYTQLTPPATLRESSALTTNHIGKNIDSPAPCLLIGAMSDTTGATSANNFDAGSGWNTASENTNNGAGAPSIFMADKGASGANPAPAASYSLVATTITPIYYTAIGLIALAVS